MKIVHLFGSPRVKGNSSDITNLFFNEISDNNTQITHYPLNKMKFKGCQACDACKIKVDDCILKDDLTSALSQVIDADIIVMSSPVYFGDVTAQLKAAIDRFYCFFVPHYWKETVKTRLPIGKTLIMILPQGAVDENRFSDIGPRYESIFKDLGFDKFHCLRIPSAYFIGQAKSNPSFNTTIIEFSKQIFNNQ